MIGKVLRGRYKITDSLGSGGSGETYIAVDIDRLNARCVVKRLKLSSNDPKVLEKVRRMFCQEAEMLEALGREHRQIPTLLAYFEEEEEFYLVQDFIEGQPLNVELPSGHRWSEAKVIQLLQDVLQILGFIHHRGVIHRDLKPANLIRQQQDGKLVLIDFGAVKQMQQDPSTPTPLNPTTIVIGTEGYIPTEQLRGKPRPSSDIYALGIIGIQAITGASPGNLQEDPESGEINWCSYVPQINEELAAILTKMVRYHFKDRYQTASEVLQDLQPLVNRYGLQSTAQQGFPPMGASQIQPTPGSGTVDQPETKFVFPPNSDPSAQQNKLSIRQLFGWFTVNRTRSIVGLGLVIGAISIPIGTWFLVNSNGLRGDYRKLQSYLQKQDWKNADEETYQTMLKIAGPISERQGYFNDQEWDKFPCSDLKEIDQLWSKVSGGKLGFSAQNRVRQASGTKDFYSKIGWQSRDSNSTKNSWLVGWKYDQESKTVKYLPGKSPDFNNPTSIEGHLPAKLQWESSGDHRLTGFDRCGL